MKAGSLALVSVAVAALLPSTSHAGVRTVCRLVTDAAGDTEIVATDSMDILSADIASDARKVVVVIRVKSWSETEPTAPMGRVFKITFTGQGGAHPVWLSYVTTPTGSSFNYGYVDAAGVSEGAGDANGKIADGVLRISAPITALSALPDVGSFKPGKRITDISVYSGRFLGAYVSKDYYASMTEPADVAETTKTYVAGTKTCVSLRG